jgi:cytochrome c oxidase subunit II
MKLRRRVLPALLAFTLMTQIPGISIAQETTNTIEIHAHRFSFAPAEINLKKGETVTLRLISDDVPHSLVVPGLKINAAMVKSHPTDITVTPENTGDFKGQCGKFCGSGHGSMLFTVHVKD